MPRSSMSADEVRAGIAADLAAFATDELASVPRLVSDLEVEVQGFEVRGGTDTELRKIIRRHGVEASAESIRAAMKRHTKLRKAAVTMKAKPLRSRQFRSRAAVRLNRLRRSGLLYFGDSDEDSNGVDR